MYIYHRVLSHIEGKFLMKMDKQRLCRIENLNIYMYSYIHRFMMME